MNDGLVSSSHSQRFHSRGFSAAMQSGTQCHSVGASPCTCAIHCAWLFALSPCACALKIRLTLCAKGGPVQPLSHNRCSLSKNPGLYPPCPFDRMRQTQGIYRNTGFDPQSLLPTSLSGRTITLHGRRIRVLHALRVHDQDTRQALRPSLLQAAPT